MNNLNYAWDMINGTCSDQSKKVFVIGPHNEIRCGDAFVTTKYSSAVFETSDWWIKALALPVYDRISGAHHRIDLTVTSKTSAAAHGILGQSFSPNTFESTNGAHDTYPDSGTFTTSAQAEGAIEGTSSDYSVQSIYGTYFKYSLFNVSASNDNPHKYAVAESA